MVNMVRAMMKEIRETSRALTANFFAGNTGRLQQYAEDLNGPVEFLMLAEVVIHLSSA